MIVNLTPHAITIDGFGTFESQGLARVQAIREVADNTQNGIRVIKQSFGEVEGLPAPQEGTIYIVSGMVLSALQGSRADVFAPDTGADAIRNDKGHIIAVRGLVQ